MAGGPGPSPWAPLGCPPAPGTCLRTRGGALCATPRCPAGPWGSPRPTEGTSGGRAPAGARRGLAHGHPLRLGPGPGRPARGGRDAGRLGPALLGPWLARRRPPSRLLLVTGPVRRTDWQPASCAVPSSPGPRFRGRSGSDWRLGLRPLLPQNWRLTGPPPPTASVGPGRPGAAADPGPHAAPAPSPRGRPDAASSCPSLRDSRPRFPSPGLAAASRWKMAGESVGGAPSPSPPPPPRA